jgi:tetratricopeptide (TPR) repeat protein
MHKPTPMSTILKNFLPHLRRFLILGLLCSLLLGGFAREAQPEPVIHLSYWLRSGIGQLQQGNYQQALQDFNHSLQRENNLALAYSNRCLTHIYLQDYLHAWQDCTRSLQQQSNNYLAYFHRGLAFYRLGDYSQALSDYNQTITLKPTYYQAYYNRGLVQAALKNYPFALADFNQSLRQITDPQLDALATIYNDRGLSHLALHNFTSAKADFAQALRLNKNNPSAHYNLACTAHQLGQYERSIAHLNRAIALDPLYADAYIRRGLLRHQLGYYQSALADLNQGATHLYQQGLHHNYQQILALIEQIQQQLLSLPSPIV